MGQQLLEFVFGVQWWIYAAAGVFGVAWLLFKDVAKTDHSRLKYSGYLLNDTLGARYRGFLDGTLDWFDRHLTPEISEHGWRRDQVQSAWSHNLLGWCLLLALAYPFGSMLVLWFASGAEGRIGTLPVLPETPDLAARAVPLGLMLCALFFYLFAVTSKIRWRAALFIPAIGFLSGFLSTLPDGAVAVAFAVAVAGAVAFAVAVAVAGAGAVAVAGAGAFAFAVAVAVAVAVAGAGAGAGAVAGAVAVAGAGAFAFAFAGAFASAVAGAVAFAVAGAGAVAFAIAQDWLGRRIGRPATVTTLYVSLLLVALAAVVRLSVPERDAGDASSVILFLGFLPLLNALADFASIGLTRFCLRRGLDGRLRFAALWDLAGAAVIFVLLVIALMAVAHWVRWADGAPLMDLAGTLGDIRAHPGDYWWLYFTFLSTLIPTLLHAAIAILGFGVTWFPWLRRTIVDGLTEASKGDAVAGRLAVWALCAAITVSVMIPVLLVGLVVPHAPWIGLAMLDVFEWIAGVMGAPIWSSYSGVGAGAA